MERNKPIKKWDADFQEFISTPDIQVPAHFNDRVIAQVRSKLHPSPWNVFGKITLIQFFVGTLSLLFCPQFGIGFTSSMGLMHYLMQFGEGVCMLGCGAFFAGGSILVSSLVLRPEEVRTLKDRKILQLTTLSTLSLGAFLCLGGEVVATLGLVWILGTLLGGSCALETGWSVRRFIAARAHL